jgi:hypothetical protein
MLFNNPQTPARTPGMCKVTLLWVLTGDRMARYNKESRVLDSWLRLPLLIM